jgi:hypothetical protein
MPALNGNEEPFNGNFGPVNGQRPKCGEPTNPEPRLPNPGLVN